MQLQLQIYCPPTNRGCRSTAGCSGGLCPASRAARGVSHCTLQRWLNNVAVDQRSERSPRDAGGEEDRQPRGSRRRPWGAGAPTLPQLGHWCLWQVRFIPGCQWSRQTSCGSVVVPGGVCWQRSEGSLGTCPPQARTLLLASAEPAWPRADCCCQGAALGAYCPSVH